MKKYLILSAILTAFGTTWAQEATPTGKALTASIGGGTFFISLFVGVILAIAFDIVLTSLSLAAGVTTLKTLTARHSQWVQSGETGEKTTVFETIRKISTAYGIWALATTSIALFVACWLAVKLSTSTSNMIGVVLGLGIWGLFYIAMTTLQTAAVSSLVGSLMNTAKAGLRSIKDTVAALFTSSEESKAPDTTSRVIASVREELFGGRGDFRSQVTRFVQELKPKPIDPRDIRDALAKLFNDAEIRSMTVPDRKLDRDKLIYSLHLKYGAGERVARVGDAAKEEISSDKPVLEKATDTTLQATGMSKEEAENLRRRWEDYLRSTGKEALTPEAIKREVEMLFTDPNAAREALKSRAGEAFNRSTIIGVLIQRKDMTKEEAERTVGWVDNILQQIRQKGGAARKTLEDVKGGAVAKVRDYLNSLDRPELKYEGLRDDLFKLFHDPKTEAGTLIQRFKSLDRDTIKAIIASRKNLSEEDADYILQEFESMRDSMVSKAESLRNEVERRLIETKEETRYRTEEARKTAASAAWWSFAIAAGSGVAAVLGALLAVR